MKGNGRLTAYALPEIPLQVHGRTASGLSPLTLFWSGSSLEVNAKGSELWAELESDYDIYEPWVSFLIDDAPVSRFMLTAGRRWYCVFRGMNPDTVKNVRILRDTQAMAGDAACLLQIYGLRLDGAFLPVEEKPYRLEFVGDSLTAGEGTIGAGKEEDWISLFLSGTYSYAELTAEALNADYRVVSQSGWGVLCGWDNNPRQAIPRIYSEVCGVLEGERNRRLGANEPYDFSSWRPDAVIVNLGTNDGSAFDSPEWTDSKTGERFRMRRSEDGTFRREDVDRFEAAAVDFLKELRRYNPGTRILWAYGMAGTSMADAVRRAVGRYAAQSRDSRAAYLPLPEMTPETVGSRNHPGIPAHRLAAGVLVDELKKYLPPVG